MIQSLNICHIIWTCIMKPLLYILIYYNVMLPGRNCTHHDAEWRPIPRRGPTLRRRGDSYQPGRRVWEEGCYPHVYRHMWGRLDQTSWCPTQWIGKSTTTPSLLTMAFIFFFFYAREYKRRRKQAVSNPTIPLSNQTRAASSHSSQ